MGYGRCIRAGWVVAATGLLAGWLGGCGGDGMVSNAKEVVIQREVNLDGKTVVVIPFREKGGAYYDSMDGTELAERVANQMRGHLGGTRFVSALAARQKLGEEKVKEATGQELGKAAGADVVLLGNVKEFRTQDPGAIGYLRGTCSMEVMVMDVKNGQELARWTVDKQFPQRGVGVASGDMTDDKVRDGTMKLMADTIAKKFYTYKKSKLEPAMEW